MPEFQPIARPSNHRPSSPMHARFLTQLCGPPVGHTCFFQCSRNKCLRCRRKSEKDQHRHQCAQHRPVLPGTRVEFDDRDEYHSKGRVKQESCGPSFAGLGDSGEGELIFVLQGPRGAAGPRPRIRLRWANSILTFLRVGPAIFLSTSETAHSRSGSRTPSCSSRMRYLAAASGPARLARRGLAVGFQRKV